MALVCLGMTLCSHATAQSSSQLHMQVPAEYQVTVTALRDLVRSIIANAGPSAGKKREAEDNSKKIGALFWRMNAGELKPEILDKLRALGSAIQSGNRDEANIIRVRRHSILAGFLLSSQHHPGSCQHSRGSLDPQYCLPPSLALPLRQPLFR